MELRENFRSSGFVNDIEAIRGILELNRWIASFFFNTNIDVALIFAIPSSETTLNPYKVFMTWESRSHHREETSWQNRQQSQPGRQWFLQETYG